MIVKKQGAINETKQLIKENAYIRRNNDGLI
jgi:hypothetical protein